jgi:hypothetical protein
VTRSEAWTGHIHSLLQITNDSLSFKFNRIVRRCLVVRRRTFHFPSQSYVTTNGQSVLVSISIFGPRSDYCYCHTVAGLLMRGAFSDERTDMSFEVAAGLASAFILGPKSR